MPIQKYLVSVTRKNKRTTGYKYTDFIVNAKSRERAMYFVFLKHGYARNEIVTCRLAQWFEICAACETQKAIKVFDGSHFCAACYTERVHAE